MAAADPKQILRDVFGFDDYRPGQKSVMSALWKHNAALAVFPTGGGKSLCYQLPALMFEGVTLVVSPLIALMKDQIDFLQRRGIAAARLDSSLDATRAARRQRPAARRRARSCCTSRPSASTTSASSRSCERARSRCSPSTKRTASPSGATTSGPTT